MLSIVDIIETLSRLLWTFSCMRVTGLLTSTVLICVAFRFRIQDLQPGKEYSVCLLVHLVQLDMLNGSPSQPTTFVTPPCQPDQPQPPRVVQKTRTSMQLKWSATADNGAPVQHYILEWDLGQGNWTEIFRTRTKQHNLAKLQPATTYKFRLCAVNECGKR